MEKHNKDLVSGASMAPKRTSASVTRRSFVAKAAAVGALAGVADALAAPRTLKHSASLSGADIGYSDILRTPDLIRVYTEIAVPLVLTRSGDEWQSKGILIECAVGETELKINVHAEHIPLQYIHLRWNAPVSDAVQVLGDQWERSYGDLGWRNMIPERVMPWYMATYDGRRCLRGQDERACAMLLANGHEWHLTLAKRVKRGGRSSTGTTSVGRRYGNYSPRLRW